MYNTVISIKSKAHIVLFSALFFIMNVSFFYINDVTAGEKTVVQANLSEAEKIAAIVARESNKKIEPPPELEKGWAAKLKKKNLREFFVIGVIINIVMMFFFIRWSYREWHKTSKKT